MRGIERELHRVDKEILEAQLYDRGVNKRLYRKKQRILKRIEGRDVRWTMGITHGGGVPVDKKEEYGVRVALLKMREELERC